MLQHARWDSPSWHVQTIANQTVLDDINKKRAYLFYVKGLTRKFWWTTVWHILFLTNFIENWTNYWVKQRIDNGQKFGHVKIWRIVRLIQITVNSFPTIVTIWLKDHQSLMIKLQTKYSDKIILTFRQKSVDPLPVWVTSSRLPV